MKLSTWIGINQDTVVKYLHCLVRTDLLLLLETDTYGISKLNKPEKIYLNNPIAADNIEYAYKNTLPVWMFGFLY